MYNVKRIGYVLCSVVGLLLCITGCTNGDLLTYYERNGVIIAVDANVNYRKLTGDEIINWFPQCKDKILMGDYEQQGAKYRVYRMGSDEQAVILTFKGGFDAGMPPVIRTDVQLPDLVNELPVLIRPAHTNGEFDIIDDESIEAIVSKLNESTTSVAQFQVDPSQGYCFLCYYKGFPFIARLVFIQSCDGGTFVVQTQTLTNKNEVIVELTSDNEKKILSDVFMKLSEAGVERSITIGDGLNDTVPTW